MMARSHAASGWCAGLLVAPLLGATTAAQSLLVAATVAGWSLAPDLDHPGAVATRWGGWLTAWLSRGLRALSAAVFEATRTPRDRDSEGTHRHLSHTIVFAGVLGAGTAVGTWLAPWWGVLVPVALGTLLAGRVLGMWVLCAGTVPAVWGLVVGGDELSPVRGWIGVAVALGCVVHILGDALTRAGVPFLWPLPIRGQRWFRIGSPRVLRFAAGGDAERLVVFPVFALLGALLCPGVLPVAVSSIAAFV
jgi:membrane-bound metal-dependent hydrolase YbcI (DUF457 family)